MITSTIIAYSGNGDCAGIVPTSNDYNVDADNSCALIQPNDIPMIDPLLGALADNGGDTVTHMVPTFSPIVDAVPVGVNGCGVEVAVDQRDVSREQASGCEPGAYETVGNSAPIANVDVYATAKNDPLIITGTGVLSNDIDYNNDPITVTVYTTPNFGSVTVDPSGSFVFTPAIGFIGRASFFYTMTDGIATDSAKVVIDVYEVVATLGIDDGGAGTVKLAWNTDSTVCDYKVYRNTSPYGVFSLVAVIPAANDYDDPGAIGDSGTNYYYYVEASCLGAHYFNNTNKTGEFDFSMEPGS